MTVEFVLLLFINNGELIEYTVRDGLTMKTKRERNMQIDPDRQYEGCKVVMQKIRS